MKSSITIHLNLINTKLQTLLIRNLSSYCRFQILIKQFLLLYLLALWLFGGLSKKNIVTFWFNPFQGCMKGGSFSWHCMPCYWYSTTSWFYNFVFLFVTWYQSWNIQSLRVLIIPTCKPWKGWISITLGETQSTGADLIQP